MRFLEILNYYRKRITTQKKFSTRFRGWFPFVGTRGTVLVEMGQLQEGVKLLKEAFEKHTVGYNKALNACYLAIAYFRMGDRQQAVNYLKLAVQLDSECSLLERAEAELNGGPVKQV